MPSIDHQDVTFKFVMSRCVSDPCSVHVRGLLSIRNVSATNGRHRTLSYYTFYVSHSALKAQRQHVCNLARDVPSSSPPAGPKQPGPDQDDQCDPASSCSECYSTLQFGSRLSKRHSCQAYSWSGSGHGTSPLVITCTGEPRPADMGRPH